MRVVVQALLQVLIQHGQIDETLVKVFVLQEIAHKQPRLWMAGVREREDGKGGRERDGEKERRKESKQENEK